ncbi:unnamed protein product [Clonostachys byssicola]|uniref:Xylanolytic transcriptional activator regulatory domain-containing protein n=1 Tax=Clonostachys byssicola TaxID=160290 RepID=A0A9N9U1M1_9HYPO|nr:unnamed protein product [Clonostachys byssicola]
MEQELFRESTESPEVISNHRTERSQSYTSPDLAPSVASSRRGQNESEALSTTQGITPTDSPGAETGYLSLSAMAELSREKPLSGSTFSFFTLMNSATGAALSNSSRSLLRPLNGIPWVSLLQNREMATFDTKRAFQEFLDFVSHSLPFICTIDLVAQHTSFTEAQENGEIESLARERPDIVVLISMSIASGVLMSKDRRHLESYAMALALSAHDSSQRLFAQCNDLQITQCLTAMAIFSLYNPLVGSPWHLLGLAMTRCVSGGMHDTRVSDFGSDDPEKKGKSRSFWSLYFLDVHLHLLTLNAKKTSYNAGTRIKQSFCDAHPEALLKA